jgi:aminopeptidase S
MPVQLATDPVSSRDLVTGASAGTGPTANDVDGGRTSVRSGVIALPEAGSLTLGVRWYIAHSTNATINDYLRITAVSETGRSVVVLDQKGQSGIRMAGAWTTTTADISELAGQEVRILVEAVDGGRESLFEAGVDDIDITEQ